MRRRWCDACAALGANAAAAQPTTERVTFPAAEGKTTLVASLMRPVGEAPGPALLLLHGCSGAGGPPL